MTRVNQFSVRRLLVAMSLANVACWLASDFIAGTWRSLFDAPAGLAFVAAALAALVGNVRQVCFVGLAVLTLVPLGVASVCAMVFWVLNAL